VRKGPGGRWLMALVLVLLALARPAGATVIVAADLRELVAGSSWIVHGRVVDIHAEWREDQRRIDSFVTVEVEEAFKGNVGRRVTFVVPGGQVGIYRSITVGAPAFARGDEVVLFLNARNAPVPYVLGLSQGVFRVAPGPDGGRLVTPPAMLAHGPAGTAPTRIVRGDPARTPLPLGVFGDRIRALLAEARGSAR
jgi:hypothetical protein